MNYRSNVDFVRLTLEDIHYLHSHIKNFENQSKINTEFLETGDWGLTDYVILTNKHCSIRISSLLLTQNNFLLKFGRDAELLAMKFTNNYSPMSNSCSIK